MIKGYSKKEISDYLVNKAKRSGVELDLDNPLTIQDKISWLIVNDDCNELKSRCADKILVHSYCEEKLGKDICVPILKVYDSPYDVDFGELPDKFVLKCNHGYAMNIIVDKKNNLFTTLKDKDLKSEEDCRRQLAEWLDINFGEINRQEHYAMIRPRCFAERYISDGEGLKDYKVFCFNGKPGYIDVLSGRYTDDFHCNIYDTKWNILHMGLRGFREDPEHLDRRPDNLGLMLDYSRKLSKDFRFVRVDFYIVDGEIYLGELTFTPDGGIFKYKDRKTDIYWGNKLKL